MIVEGLNVLQTGDGRKAGPPTTFVSDFFDFSIYVDANEYHVRQWYVDRFLTFRNTVFQDESSYFHRYASLSVDEAKATALQIWNDINGVNLRENILPTRERAHLILEKGEDHSVRGVKLRKILGDRRLVKTLVLLRHGESTWNKENRFTGWTDVGSDCERAWRSAFGRRADETGRTGIRRRVYVRSQAGHQDALAGTRRNGFDVDSRSQDLATERTPLRCASGFEQDWRPSSGTAKSRSKSGAAATISLRRLCSPTMNAHRPGIRDMRI